MKNIIEDWIYTYKNTDVKFTGTAIYIDIGSNKIEYTQWF